MQDVRDFVFPALCVVCDTELERVESLICLPCWNSLEQVKRPVVEGIVERSHIEEVHSGFYYNQSFEAIVHGLKYGHYVRLADKIGEYLAAVVTHHDRMKVAAGLVPVPLHPIKLRERGYNQSALLARAIGRRTGIPVREDLLRRRANTRSQTTMATASDRVRNMADVFGTSGPAGGGSWIVVDDLITTGATANACGKALKEAGAERVFVVTAGRPIW